MNVLIAGAHGRTAQHLIKLLTDRGDNVTGIIRKESQKRNIEVLLGANAAVADLTNGDLLSLMDGIDAIVFAAAGGSGEYEAVDHRGADNLAAAAESSGVRRYVLLSANGADDPNSWGASYADYLGTKRAGEDAIKARDLDWTVLRPGALGSGAGTGNITLLTSPGGSGSIARGDVAATLLAVLGHGNTVGKTLELWSGNMPIDEAVASV